MIAEVSSEIAQLRNSSAALLSRTIQQRGTALHKSFQRTTSTCSSACFFFVVAAVRGDRLEAYLTEEETGRVGLSRHFALDCLCERVSSRLRPFLELDVRASFVFALHSAGQRAFSPQKWLSAPRVACWARPVSDWATTAGQEAGPMQLRCIGPARPREL